MDERKTPALGEDAEASVAEAVAKLDEVVGLLEKWNRQPKLLREAKELRERLGKLLATMENRPEYAQQIALRDGIGPLSDEHWRVIDTLRSHFVQYGAMPPMRLACVVTNHLDPHCVEHLFHNAREAWTVAGLPDPGEEARSYSL